VKPADEAPVFRLAELSRRFDRAAGHFDEGDFLHRRAFDGLLERLAPMQLQPACIVDLGSAAGAGSLALSRAWRRALVVSTDLSRAMLRTGLLKRRWRSRIRGVQADAHALPFREGSVDMVVANLSIPWFSRPEACLAEIARVLRREGLFAFATLGPDTLIEVRDAWLEADGENTGQHVHPFADMHDIGDALLRAGLTDPVLDVERLTITYEEPAALWRDLRVVGARNALGGRPAAMTGRQRFRRFEEALLARAPGGRFGVSVELVFGHAWGAGRRQTPQEFHVNPARIARRRTDS
jgi:malonyl-CoA O-methyltransferase